MSGGKYSRPPRLMAVGGVAGEVSRYLQAEDTAFEVARRLGPGHYRLDKVGERSPAPAARLLVNHAGGVVVWRGV